MKSLICAKMSIVGKQKPVSQDHLKRVQRGFGPCISDTEEIDGGWSFMYEGTITSCEKLYERLFEVARVLNAKVVVQGE